MKQILSLLLSLSLLLAATGCVGRAAQPPQNEPAEPLDITQELPQEPAPEPIPEPAPEPEPEPEPEPVPEEPYVRVVDPTKPMVALTFDDGPHPVHSNTILDILEENHAVATFFELGRNAARYPDVLKRMAELECEVGSHSNAHKDLSKLKQKAIVQDMKTADEAFVSALGAAPSLMRPPYGAVNKTVKASTGRAVVTWSVDTMDWSLRDTDKIVRYIQEYGDLDGEIVLLHSIYDTTAEAVRILVPWLMEQGYQLVTVSELLAYYYGEVPQANHYYGYGYFYNGVKTDAPAQLPQEPMELQFPQAKPAAPAPTPAPVPTPEPAPTPEPTPEPVPETPAPEVSQPPAEEVPPTQEEPVAPPDWIVPTPEEPPAEELPTEEPPIESPAP